MRCNLTTAKAVGGGSGNLPPALLFLLGVYKPNLRKMHFSARSEGRQKLTHHPAGQKKRPQQVTVSIGFYNANPKPAKQVLSKLDAEMRFETPPRIFKSWRCVISDLCFRHCFLAYFKNMTSCKKTC